MYTIQSLSEADAMIICSWRYEYPYDIYNYESYLSMKEKKQFFSVKEMREKEFFSIYEDDYLIGHFRFKPSQDGVLFGIGMKPDFCGKGKSSIVLEIILDYFKEHYPNQKIKLVVRRFNQRAIHAYLKAGFIIKEDDCLKQLSHPNDFIYMEKY